jgi:myo-inositol-1(or 4)-monophosphatase
MPITARYMAAKHVARRAGELAHDLFANRKAFAAHERAPGEYVAHGGRAISALIVSRLTAAFPADVFVDERHVVVADTTNRFWVIDAIDGERNFAHDVPFYAIAVAYAERGQCEVAVVYDPERDELFHVRRGEGAWCEHGGRESRLEVARCAALEQAMIAVGVDERNAGAAGQPVRHELIDAAAAARVFGAPALELAQVAAGRLDGYVGLGLEPLRAMGALLMVEEAGGYVSHAPAAGGIRSDLPIVGCAPDIARALNAIDGSWYAERAVELPFEQPAPEAMRHRRGRGAWRRWLAP